MKTNLLQKNIPSGWQQVRLGDCLVIKHGKSQKEIEVVDGKYPILATGGVIGRTNTPLYSKPSVLIGRKGTIDKPRYMDTPFWTVDTLFYSQIKENSIAKYLYYKFNTIEWYDYNEASGVPSLSATTISSIKFNLPPLSEQNRIVSVLETWDRSIEKLSKKIEIKKQIKKGLMQDLLTGKKRLKGFSDKWRFVNLGDTCKEIKTGKLDANAMIENGKYRFYTCAKDFYFINDYAFDTEALLVSGNGANVGYVHYYKGKFNAYQRTYVLFGFIENILFIKYLLDVFLKFRIKEEVREGNTPYITMDTLTDMNLKVPTHKEQQSIVHILSAADEEIKKLEDKLKIFKDQKKYLLNSLITGTIRTPETLSTKLTK